MDDSCSTEVGRKRKRLRQYCGHCDDLLGNSSFYTHKKLYFKDGVWKKAADSFGEASGLLADNINGVCDPATTVEHENDFNTSDMLQHDDEEESLGTSECAAVEREETDGWPEEEDFHLFLSDTDSDSVSSDDQDNMVEEENTDVDHSDEGEIWMDESPPEDECLTIEDDQMPERNVFLRLLAMFLFVWQAMFKISDNAVHALLLCLKLFIQVIGNAYGVDTIVALSDVIPVTLYSLRNCVGIERNNFMRFVVCPKCKTRYTMEESYRTKANGTKVSNKCEFVPFYSHPHKRSSLRKKCGTVLMMKMKSAGGKEHLYPKSTYCYKSVIESIQTLVERPGFYEKCNEWRSRSSSGNDSTMTDVYDGQVWKDFQHEADGTPFLAEPTNLALMLNCDWYQPYKHCEYSVGVLYLVILNLPREERFKEENLIIVGLIPGPKEPKLDINTFLEPLVEELQDLWNGKLLTDRSMLGAQLYRAALVCLSSDIPAARKCGGFVGHGALRGCSKCLKAFTRERFGTKADYSGVDRSAWVPRVSSDHIRYAKMARRAKTKAERKRVEAIYGARWSELFRLPYFNAVKYVVIDPMHNLLLGTAKHVLRVWTDLGVVNKKDFDTIQSRIDSMKVPHDVGRIPRKIASGFSGFTADQWKNWTCVYSLYCLKGLIDSHQYNMWSEFVHACRLLCSRVISHDDLTKADNHLQRFVTMFASVCGPQHCTPNMHLHLHLKECIEDYGPVYSFWCFSFERYNGMLGKYQHNNRNIEVQIMRKFQQSNQLNVIAWPGGYEEPFRNVLSNKKKSCASRQASSVLSDIVVLDNSSDVQVEPLFPYRNIVISEDVRHKLFTMYQAVYPGMNVKQIDLFALSCNKVKCNGVTLSVNACRSERSACIHAKWCGYNTGSDEPTIDPRAEERPAVLREVILVHIVLGNGRKCSHAVARVTWYEHHPERWFYGRGSPVQVWGLAFELESPASFIPVERITGRCAASTTAVQFDMMKERVSVIVPLCTGSTNVDMM